MSSSDTDGSVSIGLSEEESDEETATGAAAGGGAGGVGSKPGMNRSGSVAAALAAQRKAAMSETERLAIAIQNVFRGKRSREDTEDGQIKELFVMPPVTSTGESIEQLVGDDGVYQTTLTLGHDSNKKTGEWSVYLDVREPVILHHVTFDVGNDPLKPDFFKTDFTFPFSASMRSGVLREGDMLLIKGNKAVRLGGNGQPAVARGGKPAEPLKRADSAWYSSPQRVTLHGIKGVAGETIDLRLHATRVRCTRHQPAAAERARQAQFDAQGARRRPLPQVL